MLNCDKIKYYYDNKYWDKGQVWDAVNAKSLKITQAQYTEITGYEYPIEKPSDKQ